MTMTETIVAEPTETELATIAAWLISEVDPTLAEGLLFAWSIGTGDERDILRNRLCHNADHAMDGTTPCGGEEC